MRACFYKLRCKPILLKAHKIKEIKLVLSLYARKQQRPKLIQTNAVWLFAGAKLSMLTIIEYVSLSV